MTEVTGVLETDQTPKLHLVHTGTLPSLPTPEHPSHNPSAPAGPPRPNGGALFSEVLIFRSMPHDTLTRQRSVDIFAGLAQSRKRRESTAAAHQFLTRESYRLTQSA